MRGDTWVVEEASRRTGEKLDPEVQVHGLALGRPTLKGQLVVNSKLTGHLLFDSTNKALDRKPHGEPPRALVRTSRRGVWTTHIPIKFGAATAPGYGHEAIDCVGTPGPSRCVTE